jgi:hypothetical protein
MGNERKLTKGSGKRAEFEAAWKDRLHDADALLAAGRFAAAIASGIYGVEILLKSMICRRLEIDFLPGAFRDS